MNPTRHLATTLALCAALLSTPAPAAAATTDATARAAADRTARDMAATGDILGGGSDVTLTLDALVLFAATGTSGDTARRGVDRIVAAQSSYLAGAATGDEGRRAKLAYVLQVAGRDASQLTTDLRASLQPDGRFGTATNPFGQAFGVLALARTAEGAPAAAVARLEELQCTSTGHVNHGAFSFGGCASGDGDTTGIVVGALLAAGRTSGDASIAGAVGWLQRRQNADGSFGTSGTVGTGNANSTGIAAYAARQVGTAASVAVADAAAAYLRDLQVTCASPIIAGSDPSVGGGFPASWVGTIAYDASAQDSAITDGIGPAQYVQWRYATLQAALAMPGVASMHAATLTGAEGPTAAAPACAIPTTTPTNDPTTDGTGGTGGSTTDTSLPRARFRVRASSLPVPTGGRTMISATGFAPRERWTLLLSGRVLARGVATARGTLHRRVVVPRSFGSHPSRLLRILGSTTRRSGTTRLATAAPRTLIAPARRTVRRGSTVRIVVRGLLPRERVSAVVARRRVHATTASRTGRAIVVVRIAPRATRTQRLVICGVSCARRVVVRLELAQ